MPNYDFSLQKYSVSSNTGAPIYAWTSGTDTRYAAEPPAATGWTKGEIIGYAGVGGSTGFGGINASGLGTSLTQATQALNSKLNNLDVSDPGQLIAMQQQLAVYTVGLQTISAVSKSLEDTLKAIVRNMG